MCSASRRSAVTATVRRRLNKQGRAHATIRERVLSGAYGPGHRLVIDTLAAELGVSAVPVREAIRRLEAEGLVLHRRNVGAYVTPVDPLRFEEILSVLAVLEGHATALAAPFLTPDDLDHLRELTEAMAACMDCLDALGFGRADNAFHDLIYDRCSNAYLVEALNETTYRLDASGRAALANTVYRGRDTISEHRGLVQLIADGAPLTEIETAARAHKLAGVESFRHRASTSGSAIAPLRLAAEPGVRHD